MGRNNRSRKRRDAMNLIKKERYEKKDLERLKKMLGVTDAQGNVDMTEVAEIAKVKTAREIKKEKKQKEEAEINVELAELQDKGEDIETVNEKTGKVHVYNTKTFKDQNGSYPAWYKPKKTVRRIRKLTHARKQRFRQAWSTTNVPL